MTRNLPDIANAQRTRFGTASEAHRLFLKHRNWAAPANKTAEEVAAESAAWNDFLRTI